MSSSFNATDYPATAARRAPLSARQLECLAWAQEGKSATDIGQIIGISGRTVEGHLAKACERLNVRTRVQAVVHARDLGWLPAAPQALEARSTGPRSFRDQVGSPSLAANHRGAPRS
jgi:DNA-binding CsgD family transcriptional regulator